MIFLHAYSLSTVARLLLAGVLSWFVASKPCKGVWPMPVLKMSKSINLGVASMQSSVICYGHGVSFPTYIRPENWLVWQDQGGHKVDVRPCGTKALERHTAVQGSQWCCCRGPDNGESRVLFDSRTISLSCMHERESSCAQQNNTASLCFVS